MKTETISGHQRYIPLEALRGLAALTVVFGHFFGVFGISWAPEYAILHILTNGTAAVTVFFVLSGFVLALPYLTKGEDGDLIRSGIKRWPRLAGPVFLATLFSYGLFRFGLYQHKELGLLLNNSWLTTFGDSNHNSFDYSFFSAVKEGLFETFFLYQHHFNFVLWTITLELFGSYLTFMLVFSIRQTTRVGTTVAVALACAMSYYLNPNLISFICGTLLAFFIVDRAPRLPMLPAILLLITGAYFFGYAEPVRAYSWLAGIQYGPMYRFDHIVLHTFSGLLFVLCLTSNVRISSWMTCFGFKWLGKLSFPIYLYHVPVLCCVSIAVYLAEQQAGGSRTSSLYLAAAAGLPCLMVLSLVAAYVDQWWLELINRWSESFVKSKRI